LHTEIIFIGDTGDSGDFSGVKVLNSCGNIIGSTPFQPGGCNKAEILHLPRCKYEHN